MNYYNNNTYFREIPDEELIQPLTRESINNAAQKEGIEINWNNWDKAVKRVRKEIKDGLKNYKKPHWGGKRKTPVIQYDISMRVVRKYECMSDVVKHGFKIPSVANAIKNNRPLFKKWIFKYDE